jgi:hypothetical protein
MDESDIYSAWTDIELDLNLAPVMVCAKCGMQFQEPLNYGQWECVQVEEWVNLTGERKYRFGILSDHSLYWNFHYTDKDDIKMPVAVFVAKKELFHNNRAVHAPPPPPSGTYRITDNLTIKRYDKNTFDTIINCYPKLPPDVRRMPNKPLFGTIPIYVKQYDSTDYAAVTSLLIEPV